MHPWIGEPPLAGAAPQDPQARGRSRRLRRTTHRRRGWLVGIALVAGCGERLTPPPTSPGTQAGLRASLTTASSATTVFEADVHLVMEQGTGPATVRAATRYHLKQDLGDGWSRVELTPPTLPLSDTTGLAITSLATDPWSHIRRVVVDSRTPTGVAELRDGTTVPMRADALPTLAPVDSPLMLLPPTPPGPPPPDPCHGALGGAPATTTATPGGGLLSTFVRAVDPRAGTDGSAAPATITCPAAAPNTTTTTPVPRFERTWTRLASGHYVLQTMTMYPPSDAPASAPVVRMRVLSPRYVVTTTAP